MTAPSSVNCHQTSYTVSSGETVRAGELIGYIGSTGHVTGPTCTSRSAPAGATRSTRTPPSSCGDALTVGRGGTKSRHETPGPLTALELLDRRVPQQQPLDALRPEVDRRDRPVATPSSATTVPSRRCRAGPGHRARAKGSRGPAWPWRPRRPARRPRRSCGARRRSGARPSGCRRRPGRGATTSSGPPRCAASRPGRPAARRGTATRGCAGAPHAERISARET